MSDSVTCSNCGAPVIDPAVAPAARCAVCGSTARTVERSGFSLSVSLGTATLAVINDLPAAPPFLLQTVVIRGDRVADGQLIEAVALPWLEIVAAIGRDARVAYQIPPHHWEELIAGAYKRAGFDEVILTPRSGDGGRDVIATKQALGTIRVIDQVKAYGPGHLVTADDVRSLLGVLHADGASKGFLTTTSDFAPKLRNDVLLQPFMPSRLELVNGTMLRDRLTSLVRPPA